MSEYSPHVVDPVIVEPEAVTSVRPIDQQLDVLSDAVGEGATR